MKSTSINLNKADLKAMYDRLAECPIIDDSIFNVNDDDITNYISNNNSDDDIKELLNKVDILFDTNTNINENNDSNSNSNSLKEFLGKY